MATDGSLKFDTKINTEGFDGGVTSLKSAMEKLTVTIERLSNNIVRAFDGAGEAVARTGVRANQTASQVDGIADSAQRAEREAEALRQQMASITVTGLDDGGTAVTPVESGQTQAIDQEAAAMNDLRMSSESARASLEAWKDNRASLSLEEIAERAEVARQKMEALKTVGVPVDNAALQQAIADYDHWISEMEGAGAAMQADQAPVDIPVELDLDSFESQINMLKTQLAELHNQGLTLGNPEYDSTYTQLQQVIQAENEYKRSLLNVDSGQRQAEKSARRMNRTMRDTKKAAIPLSKSILKLSSMFKLMIIRMAMRAVIRGVQEGFQNLAQYSDGVNATLSELTSSLMYLKNSFATAFAPVLDVVVPALSAMIDAIASALAWIGQLFAALNGKSTFVKAKKTQEDYAAGLKKTGSAAKQAGKDAKKALAPFDELNMLTSKDKSDSGGGGASETDPSQMFETVEIDKNISSLVDSMKGAFADFLTWAQTNFGPSLAKVWDDMIPNIENFKGILAGIWNDMESLADPLMEWFNTDFVAFLQQLILTGGDIINGLFDSFNTVFSDIWNLVAFPFLENFITVGLPMITQFGTEMLKTLSVVFEQLKMIFDTLWRDIAAPALEILTKIWTDCVESLADVWNEFGAPIFEALREAIEKSGDSWKRIWDSYIKPVFDMFMDTADRLWTGHIKPLLDHFLEFGARLIQVALDIYNHMILPLVDWFTDIFGPGISAGVQIALAVFGTMSTVISSVIDSVLLVLNGLLDFIHKGFTDGWSKAWSNIGDIFRNVFNGIIQVAENSMNYIVDSLNSLSFDVPEWIPVIGGEKFGFDVPRVKLPRLATGTVVPPRAGEFAAILGDNNRETEVVSPLSTMKQALTEALVEAGGIGGDINLNMYLDGEKVYETIMKRNARTTSGAGKSLLLT